jgi:hypothetical protein
MVDQGLLEKLKQELNIAVKEGSLPGEVLSFIQDRSIRASSPIQDSVIITGDGNQVTFLVPEEKQALDPEQQETELLREALMVGHQHWDVLRQKQAHDLYPGLHSYMLSDAQHFFGREQVIDEICPLLSDCRVLWLQGRSGVGKSSLIQAGLIPALLDVQAYIVYVRLFARTPFQALQQEILKSSWTRVSQLAALELPAFLRKVAGCIEQRTIWILFDQFEEFFYYQPEKERAEFGEQLSLCVTDPALNVHFLFSIRSDYYGETSPIRRRLGDGVNREYYLGMPSHAEARRIIQGPLQQKGIFCSEQLIQTILNDLGKTSCESPQLQLVCEKLYRQLPADCSEILPEHYIALGAARGILENYVRQLLHAPKDELQTHYQASCYLLSTLVTPEGQRDRRTLSDWYRDERIHRMLVSQIFKHANLPENYSISSGAYLKQLAAAELSRFVKMSINELIRLVEEDEQPVTPVYLFLQQKMFVDEAVRILRDLRLISETEDGENAFELSHEYLISEVRNLLDSEELDARRVQRMLIQKLLDYADHSFFLEPRELTLVINQSANPKLVLTNDQKRLVLLSAVEQRLGSQVIDFVGKEAIIWLRQAMFEPALPDSTRLKTAICLGEQRDKLAIEKIQTQLANPSNQPQENYWLDLTAHYFHGAGGKPRDSFGTLSFSQRLRIFLTQARLRIQDRQAEHANITKAAVIIATISMLTATMIDNVVLHLISWDNLGYFIFTIFVFTMIGVIGGIIFSETLFITRTVIEKWNFVWRVLILTGLGCLSGAVFFSALNVNITGGAPWYTGSALSLGLALIPTKMKQPAARLRVYIPIAIGLVTAGLYFFHPAIDQKGLLFGGSIGAGLFAAAYVICWMKQSIKARK